MITRLQVRGFKSLLDVDVTLGPLTVFVGANGSGKTSVLEAIDVLRDMMVVEFEDGESYDGQDVVRTLSRQGAELVEIDVSLTVRGIEGHFQTRFGEGGFERRVLEGVEQTTLPGDKSELSPWASDAANGIQFYRLDAEAMAQAAYSDDTNPKLDFDGENLAAVLDALQGEAREQFGEIERRMIEFVPALRRLRIKRARARGPVRWTVDRLTQRRIKEPPIQVIGHQVAFDFEHAPDISAEDASEGTLLLLGLLTIIESKPPGDMTIMLDDLDRALHPKAQRELVGYLHELVRTRPGLQIIATTHSPYLVEHLEYDEVRAITQQPDGTSVVASLADHPQADRWREEMSAGEFWSSVGESWVATGKQ